MLEMDVNSEKINFNYGELDDPGRLPEIKKTIDSKIPLKAFYCKVYKEYQECLARIKNPKVCVELGSGASFAKEFVGGLLYTDVIAYAGIDLVVDATNMPFQDESVDFICMLNTLHHIPNAEKFFREASRVLALGGRIFIADQHLGWISSFVLKYLHKEGFNPDAKTWAFPSKGPLSSANGALSWIIFKRDLSLFQHLFPQFNLVRYQTHTPLMYWLSGGLKKWTLIPKGLIVLFEKLDKFLLKISPEFGSFNFIELEKISPKPNEFALNPR